MKRHSTTYNKSQLVSAVFMIVALLWLTISIPFVYASQQQLAEQSDASAQSTLNTGNEEETSKPLGNNTEEKTSNNATSVSEEYLHDHHEEHYIAPSALQFNKSKNADTYVAYHGELLVPPPNVA